ncbi:Regulator of chromosome condensation, rcc (substrate of the Dot/Icm secretion system) [Legionella pneumophila subsp. pneumophila]|uniref:Regulator of chromosome condensation, rcc (substrate of the Dot/Icm secretion system) n=1 Tax=Legionella pneumophila TaxID=446 RepID=UPI00026D9A99|nr:Regulator of chromosome condensation, rcc (substrate of the Dot/Icm secretion system) [Legionella pneumophila]CCD09560.1 Regulator of chromosome condensation, rcc (substrate of the Dot/Icm secretion system) [Legionella pneumophila subsp. pneumophila]
MKEPRELNRQPNPEHMAQLIKDTPKDVWFHLAKYLPDHELLNLMQVDKRLNRFFKEGKPPKEIIKKIEHAPLKVVSSGVNTFILTQYHGKPLLLACGQNKDGQLGCGDTKIRTTLTPVNIPESFASIDSVQISLFHAVLWGRDKDNKPILATCGLNDKGQLGCGDYKSRALFTQVKLAEEITSIESVEINIFNSVILGHDKHNRPVLASCGSNHLGKLGCGDIKDKTTFTRMKLPTEIVSIDTLQMNWHTIVSGRDKNNKPVLATCGWNERNQMGWSNTEDKTALTPAKLPEDIVSIKSMQISTSRTVILGRDKNNKPILAACGLNNHGQLGCGDIKTRTTLSQIKFPKDIVSIESVQISDNHTMILGRDKHKNPIIAACGLNNYGQLGCGDTKNRMLLTLIKLPKEMVCIDSITVKYNCLFVSGRDKNHRPILTACGDNRYGQLGIPGKKLLTELTIVPTPILTLPATLKREGSSRKGATEKALVFAAHGSGEQKTQKSNRILTAIIASFGRFFTGAHPHTPDSDKESPSPKRST